MLFRLIGLGKFGLSGLRLVKSLHQSFAFFLSLHRKALHCRGFLRSTLSVVAASIDPTKFRRNERVMLGSDRVANLAGGHAATTGLVAIASTTTARGVVKGNGGYDT